MSRQWLGALVLLIASTSCVSVERPAVQDETVQVARIRNASEAFLRAQVEQSWERWLSGSIIDPGAPAATREWLFTPAVLDTLRRAIRKEPAGDSRRALHYLHAMLVGEDVKLATLDIDERLWALERSLLKVGDESLAYRDLGSRLAREPSALARRAWSDAAAPTLAAMGPLLRDREAEIRRFAHKLGYDDRLRLSSEIRQYDLTRVAAPARAILDETEALYLAALEELAERELDLEVRQLRPADIPRLLLSPRFQEAFPADGMLDVIEATVSDLGVSLASLPIQIDARPLESKHPRAACFPIAVPTDIRLSVKASGGAADYSALLHEVGHALHFANTRTVAFELQVLGDASSAEALAIVFESLADDPTWLAARLGMVEPALTDYVHVATLKRLLMVRRYAARVLVELETQTGKARDREKLYGELMSRAYGFPLDKIDIAHLLVDQDPFLAAADYVRGYLVAASLVADLQAHFGARWWQAPGALDRLRDFWTRGQRDTADELALKVDARGIAPEALMRLAALALATGAEPTSSPPTSVSGNRQETR
jgi:hypothetical protein